MKYMFRDAQAFNQEIRTWDVSNVTTFSSMFDSNSLLMIIAPWNAPFTPDASWFNQ